MSNNIAPMQTPAPIRPRDYTDAQLALIRRTVAADAKPDEFNLFIEASKRIGLDPFRKQIYCLVFNKDNEKRRSVSFITSIQGYRSIAERVGNYRPDENEPEWVVKDELKKATNPLGIEKATVTVWKMDRSGQWNPIKGVAYWDEFAPIREKWEKGPDGWQPTGEMYLDRSGNWGKMGRHMIAKCAEGQALQKGWPEETSGVELFDRMDHVVARDMDATAAANAAEEDARLERIHAKDAVPFVWEYGGGVVFTPAGQVADKVLEFIRDNDPAQVDWFAKTNVEGLRQFWAVSPSDALAVKAEIEKAIKPQIEQPDMVGNGHEDQ